MTASVEPDGAENLAAIIDEPADAAPDRVALAMADGSTCTYGGLRDQVTRWSATLAAAGVSAGDRVAVVDWGGTRSAAVTLAVAHLGAATTQMNPLLTARELAQLVEVSSSGPVGVAGDDGGDHLLTALGSGGTVLDHPDQSLDPDRTPPPAPGGDAAAVVLFTSGTTGVPKAVPISHRAALERIRAYRGPFDASRAPSVTLMCAPSFHVGGMLGLLVNLYGGDTTVVQPRFDAGGWLALVERHRVASAFVVPTMLARILDHPDLSTTDTSSLRMISYGAAAAPTELVRRALDQWPDVGFANTFGQTETIGAYTSLTPADHRDPRRIGSVGRALPGVEVRVVDPATGHDVEPDAVGEIWVRSAQVAPASGTGLDDGWLHSGDLARMDADGYLYPLGRMSDTINRGGEKFAPAEVAECLRTHPAVADVVVAGLPDAELGHRVGAAIVVRPGEPVPSRDELRDWCRRDLAGFKLPDIVVVVDALPFNEVGKLPRSAAVELITTAAAAAGGAP
ncbi:MAG: class I adenylate-forming enzyme family protein [Acidimicrobiales bacterium]